MIRKRATFIAAGIITVALATTAGSCNGGTSKVAQPYNDAHVSSTQYRLTWNIVPAPDGFKNTATACLVLPDGTHTHIRMFRGFSDANSGAAISDVVDPIGCP